jgi:signal transduction histidine kinase
MHPSPAPRRSHLSEAAGLITGLWLLALGAMCLTVYLGTAEYPLQGYIRAVLMALTGAGLSAIVWSSGARRQFGTVGRALFFGAAILIAILIHVAIDLWTADLLRIAFGYPLPVRRVISDNWLRGVLMGLLVRSNVPVFATAHAFFGMAAVALSAAVESRERERMLAEAQAATTAAQLASLRYQLNPHFLFNTLNALQSLIESGRNADAKRMIERLADFLRSTLAEGTAALSTIEDELATIQDYLAIEAVRFGDRLRVHFDCPAAVREALLPTFVLQPLVENALKHGVAPALSAVDVDIAARIEGAHVIVSVRNGTMPGNDVNARRGAGVGLRNTSDRLALIYGDDASLTSEARDGSYCATLRLPLRIGSAT